MKALRDELKRIDGANSALFARVLTDVSLDNLSSEMRVKLGGAI